MLLDKSSIKSKNLLLNSVDNSYKEASYDLNIDGIADLSFTNARDRILSRYTLQPGGMVLAFSKEVFQLPNNVLGITTVKNTLSNKGIMAVNIGLVDPGYKGPISCILINFGLREVIICNNDPFLRMTFHELQNIKSIEEPDKVTPEVIQEIKNTYIDDRLKSSTEFLGDTFLSLNNLKSDVLNKAKSQIIPALMKQITIILAIISLVTFLLTQVTTISDTSKLNNKLIELEKKINSQDIEKNSK